MMRSSGQFCLAYALGALTVLCLGLGFGAVALTVGPNSIFSVAAQPTATLHPLFPNTPTARPASPTPVRQQPTPTVPARTATPTGSAGPALNTAQIVEKVKPAVVQIVAGNSSGTGMIVDGNGNILTNEHVVEGATSVTVRLNGGRTLQGRVVATDPDRDLAIVRVQSANLPTVKFGDSNALQIGEDVVAMGFALNLPGEASVSRGVVSGVRPATRTDLKYVQTDASVNPGNSGGPLLNTRGEVVGIVTSRITSDAGRPVTGISLAIAISSAKPTIDRLISAR